jgi:acyl carrier protein
MPGTIQQALSNYIASQILKDPSRSIRGEEALLTSGLVDSFSLVDLALFVEDTFGVQIQDSELNSKTFDTLNQLEALIEQRLDKA